MVKQVPTVSVKNTKEQILAAYQEALEKLEKKEVSPKEVQKTEGMKALVEKASAYSDESILKDLSSLKSSVIKQIDSLSENLLNQFNVFNTLSKAIEIEQKHLKEVYEIQENAHSLSALILSQQEEKKKFEEQVCALRHTWKSDKEMLEKDFNETKERLEKERKRDEEEYKYRITIERKKEEDTYQQRKIALENELSVLSENLKKREEAITQKEEEFKRLQDQVNQFDEHVKKAVINAEKQLKALLDQQYDFEKRLKEKETEGVVSLLNEKILTLQEKVKDQNKIIDDLTQRSSSAIQQVQEIACKALDSSSKRVMVTEAA